MEYVVYLEFVDGSRYVVTTATTPAAARGKVRRLNAVIDDGRARYMTRDRFDA